MTRFHRLVATFFGIGRAPLAPGTLASLATLPLALAIAWWGGWLAVFLTTIVVFAVGIWSCGAHARTIQLKDPGECVLDEVAGQLLALVPCAFMGRLFDPGTLLAAFVLFRFFDIVKPWPIARLEHLDGGLGIMADDIAAGLAAGALVAAAVILNGV